jgi:hypothetical protein
LWVVLAPYSFLRSKLTVVSSPFREVCALFGLVMCAEGSREAGDKGQNNYNRRKQV